MIKFEKSLQAWGTTAFDAALKQEIAQHASQLPLQQGLSFGNYVTDEPVTVAIISIVELEDTIHVRAGVFYTGVLGGCSCTDDPTPVSESNEYCEVQFDIDKSTAVAVFALVVE